MKAMIGMMILCFLSSAAYAADAANKYAGNWIDVDLEASLKSFEANQDLKAFCSGAYYKGDSVDQVLLIGADGKASVCPLNADQALPLGKNCFALGAVVGDVITVKYQDGSSLLGDMKQLEAGHLQVELRHPKQGNISATEVWELRSLDDARTTNLNAAFKRCINEVK